MKYIYDKNNILNTVLRFNTYYDIIEINVIGICGQKYVLDIEKYSSIFALKDTIRLHILDWDYTMMSMIFLFMFDTGILDESKCTSDYSIEQGSCVFVGFRIV